MNVSCVAMAMIAAASPLDRSVLDVREVSIV